MPNNGRRAAEPNRAAENPGRSRPRDQDWDDRLRTVGDACFTEVQWSGRDHPCWPLPEMSGKG